MRRSLCLFVIGCAIVYLGEAGRHGYGRNPYYYGGGWGRPVYPPQPIKEICGSSTSEDLAWDVDAALTLAKKYSLDNRNSAGGWDEEAFVNTGRAIMNLQLSTDAEWYDQQLSYPYGRYGSGYGQQLDPEVCSSKSSLIGVRELETEVVTFLKTYWQGQDSLEEMGDTDLASYLVALGSTCHNINDFFGTNLNEVVNERLRRFGDGVTVGARLDGQASGASCDSLIPGGSVNRAYFWGFNLLVACQDAQLNNIQINPDYFRCTIEAQNNNLFMEPLVIPGLGPYPFGWGDLQLLGMSCLRDKVPFQYQADWNAIIGRIINWMANMQFQDGSFGGNPIATTLAIQTLKSAGASYDSWNCEGAVRNILALQDAEGKIADSLGITMLALPSLSGGSMADVDEAVPKNCYYY